VAVGAVDRPAERDPVRASDDRPLPARTAPVRGVRACSLTTAGRLVLRAVQAHLGQVELDDAVIGGQRLGGERLEHPSGDPLVTAAPQRRVRDAPAHERFDVDPGAPGDQSDEDPLEAHPVRNARPMAAQRVGIDGHGNQRLEGLPDGISHFGVERAHDDGDLHLVVVVGMHPASKPGHHHDRWMVLISALSARPLRPSRE
jgi:hypothetical protein